MIDLSDVAEYVDRSGPDGYPMLVATASKAGAPNLAFKGSVMVWDKDHLAFWERAHGETLAHLLENPKIALIYRNKEAGKMWRFWGECELLRDGDLRDGIMARTFQPELDRDPERKGVAVLIRVDKVSGAGVTQTRDA
ncbi:MAG: pyridoxamine 5'-phosphate oxidase family protein [Chloroflexi bacterium]|nr:pyridoxamine 5'-phosphate oxidase family protein [Chloroflexota bacterium]